MGIPCLAKHLEAKKTNVHNIPIETLCIIEKQSIEMHVVEFVIFKKINNVFKASDARQHVEGVECLVVSDPCGLERHTCRYTRNFYRTCCRL